MMFQMRMSMMPLLMVKVMLMMFRTIRMIMMIRLPLPHTRPL